MTKSESENKKMSDVVGQKSLSVGQGGSEESEPRFSHISQAYSLVYLSLVAETIRIFRQRNPLNKIERCSTAELVHEQKLSHSTDPGTSRSVNSFKSFQQSKNPCRVLIVDWGILTLTVALEI